MHIAELKMIQPVMNNCGVNKVSPMPGTFELWVRDCYLTHHTDAAPAGPALCKGHNTAPVGRRRGEHKGLTIDGQISCKSVKFVAEHGLKGDSTWLQST